MKSRFASLLEAIYVVYMLTFFQTDVSFHHPLEAVMMQTQGEHFQWFSTYFRHPISSEEVDYKICPFGRMGGLFLGIWILYRAYHPRLYRSTWNSFIWLSTFFLAFVLNWNALVYLFPVLLWEFFLVLQ